MMSECFIIPQRVISGIMIFLALAITIMLRVSLSYAMVEIVVMPNVQSNGTVVENPDVCPSYDDELTVIDENTSIPIHPSAYSIDSEKYDWSQETQGLILSSFYWGYVLTQVPGGVLSAKIGGKYTILLGVAIATIFNLFTPMVIRNGGTNLLIVLRVIFGLAEGLVFPSCNTLLAAWTPMGERSLAVTTVFSGMIVGNIFGSSISGLLISSYGWTSVFYCYSGIAFIWCFIFSFICYNDPDSHPFISEKEKNYLKREIGELKRRTDLPSTPWKAILTSPPMIAFTLALINHNWALMIIINALPKYMNDVLRFSIIENGLYSALPYTVYWIVALITGATSDYLIRKQYLSITNSRKLYTTISTIGPPIFIVLASYAGCNRFAVVAMITIGMGVMAPYCSGNKANCLDIAPNYAGVVLGIGNSIGNITGAFGPYIVGVLTPNSYLTEWRIVFWITFAISVVPTIYYNIFASGKVQWWNDPLNKQTMSSTISSGNEETYQSTEKPV